MSSKLFLFFSFLIINLFARSEVLDKTPGDITVDYQRYILYILTLTTLIYLLSHRFKRWISVSILLISICIYFVYFPIKIHSIFDNDNAAQSELDQGFSLLQNLDYETEKRSVPFVWFWFWSGVTIIAMPVILKKSNNNVGKI